jgi:hypothetical protein
MKNHLLISSFFLLLSLSTCTREAETPAAASFQDGDMISLSKADLQDKIKGGWAGQVIGCTYGGPTEFRFNGTMIGDHIPIPWDEHQMEWWYENSPGLYDDVYMDLTFVDIFEKHGLDAPDSLHALAFAHAEYPLWHANQAARYNILNGMMPPASGHWKNNPHADDIDFQIEADFAGLMSPGMVRASSGICDKIGHIMNYGDGVYGGAYVAAMYALAFISDDMPWIVREALKVVPEQSEFHQCIADVIRWHKQFPNDWKSAWFEAQKKWTADRGCPEGVFRAFNIDAKINAAYIVIGLLYGEGDYGKTIDISTRCGYDSDCNPANAAGILGTMIGYSNIPDYWKQGLDKVEDRNFKYTEMSLNKVYEIGMRHALEMIGRNGGSEEDDKVLIKYQAPEPMPLELGFEGLHPLERRGIGATLDRERTQVELTIKGCGFVLTGHPTKESGMPDAEVLVDVYVDGERLETVKMPTRHLVRRLEIAWKYDLPEGDHTLRVEVNNMPRGYGLRVNEAVVYSSVNPGPRNY